VYLAAPRGQQLLQRSTCGCAIGGRVALARGQGNYKTFLLLHGPGYLFATMGRGRVALARGQGNYKTVLPSCSQHKWDFMFQETQ
jgi:hypothetical protein